MSDLSEPAPEGARYMSFGAAYAAIGFLITSWATYECAVLKALRELVSGGEFDGNEASVILVNGLRFENAITALTKILDSDSATKDAAECLKEITQRAALVQKIRNIAAHRRFNMTGTNMSVYQFYMNNRKSKKKPYFAHYSIDEIHLCGLYILALSNAVTFELSQLIIGKPIPLEIQTWRNTPPLPKDPESDRQRYSSTWDPQPQSFFW